LESDYPYTGKQSTCHGSSATKVFQLAYPGSQQIERGKGAFKAALRQGPLSVSFRVSGNAFFFYGSGIMPASMCASGSVNHAMLAVGYGVEQGVEYALIQNQWGQGWGEQGLIRVELTNDQTGPCGLYTQNTYSLV
jgi:cathepsin L